MGLPGAGLLNGMASAIQLAQTGMALMGKTPESIAGAINSFTGDRPMFTQAHRYVTLETPLGPDVLLVNAMIADEHVNQLPEIHLDLLSHQNNIEPQQIVGQCVNITLDPNSRNYSLERIVAVSRSVDNRRYFDGYLASFGRVGSSGNVTRYEMSVVPWFWFLTRSTDRRIFQHQTPKSILATIAQAAAITNYRVDGEVLTGIQEGRLGPISDVTAAVMPKAVGDQIDISGSSMTSFSRHNMADVFNGMQSRAAQEQADLLHQLGEH